MGWEQRRNGKYFYRTRRVNGRIVKEYLGSGEAAEEAAKRAEARQPRLSAAERARRAEFEKLEVMFAVVDVCIDVLMEHTMTAAGYHRHDRGPWRKKRESRMTNTENQEPTLVLEPTDTERQEIKEVVKRASEGDYSAVQPLRAFINTRPGAAMALGGDVSWESLLLQVRNYAGMDLAVREAVLGRLNELRAELSGNKPELSGIERLLIEHVLSTWLHLYRLETLYADQEKPSLESDNSFQKSLTAAQQRYLTTLKELARVRKWAVPSLQINVAREQVNVNGNVTSAPAG